MFKRLCIIKFALIISFFSCFTVLPAQDNVIRAEHYTVSQPVKDSMWYICKRKGKKAGAIVKGPFANRESAIANWYYITAKSGKYCIAENLKFITNNPEKDFPLEFKAVREELETNHTEALRKYSVPINAKFEKNFIKRNTVKSDEKVYEVDLHSISKKVFFVNKLSANYTAAFPLKLGKKDRLNKGDVVIIKWKGKLSVSVSSLFINFAGRTEDAGENIEADNIFEGYAVFKIEEAVTGTAMINMFYTPEAAFESAKFQLIRRNDKVVLAPENTVKPSADEEVKEPEVTEVVEEEVEEPHFEFVPEAGNPNSLNTFRREFLQDYAVDDIFVVPVEESKKIAVVANPNEKDGKGRTQLMSAAAAGNEWQVRSLIESGADVNIQDLDGWTALMYAARYSESLSTIELLIENGAELGIQNNFESSALLIAVCYNNNPNVISKLLESYEGSDKEVLKAFVFLLSSSFPSDYVQKAKFKIFMDKGVPVNGFYNGKTPLMYAAQFSNSNELIKLLLDNDAIKTVRSVEGKTAFDYAKNNSKLKRDDVYWALNSK